MQTGQIRELLILWFRRHGRSLPWRKTTDPYAIAVSEFMLQQTRVAAVLPFFDRWMKIFPDVGTLAAAEEQEVLGIWQGLGYYSRARNLHRLAKTVVKEFAGKFPEDEEQLQKLPGIGPYSAAAIRAFAFNKCAPVLDANVIRVLARLHDYRQPVDSATGLRFLKERALELQSPGESREWNSAIMELGALICSAGRPDCLLCPVRRHCKAKTPERLPVKKPKAETTKITEQRAFIFQKDLVYLEQSTGPRWRGLWILPLMRPSAGSPKPCATLQYSITRYLVRMEVFFLQRTSGREVRGFPIEELESLPMPAPHRRAVALALKSVQY